MEIYNKSEKLLLVYRNYLSCLKYHEETNGIYGDTLEMLKMLKEELMELDTSRCLIHEYIDIIPKRKGK